MCTYKGISLVAATGKLEFANPSSMRVQYLESEASSQTSKGSGAAYIEADFG